MLLVYQEEHYVVAPDCTEGAAAFYHKKRHAGQI